MPRRYQGQPYIPSRDPLTAIPPSRHPFQFWAMVALAAGGIGNLIDPASVINELADGYVARAWAALMALSGFLSIIAAFWSDRVTGLLMERISLTAAAGVLAIYAIGVSVVAGINNATLATVLSSSLAIACLWRALHVTRELKVIKMFMARYYE